MICRDWQLCPGIESGRNSAMWLHRQRQQQCYMAALFCLHICAVGGSGATLSTDGWLLWWYGWKWLVVAARKVLSLFYQKARLSDWTVLRANNFFLSLFKLFKESNASCISSLKLHYINNGLPNVFYLTDTPATAWLGVSTTTSQCFQKLALCDTSARDRAARTGWISTSYAVVILDLINLPTQTYIQIS